MKIERIFQLLIVLFIAAGIYFWTTENKDGVFVCFVLASVSFFITIRSQAKDRIKQVEAENEKQQVS